jgi:hypothetical protein
VAKLLAISPVRGQELPGLLDSLDLIVSYHRLQPQPAKDLHRRTPAATLV